MTSLFSMRSQSPQAAIPKHQRLAGLQTEIHFSQPWRLRVQEQGACMVGFWWEPSSGLRTAVFSLCPHTAGRGRVLAGAPVMRTLTPLMRAPPSCPSKGSASWHHCTGWVGFNICVWGEHRHSVHCKVNAQNHWQERRGPWGKGGGGSVPQQATGETWASPRETWREPAEIRNR